MAKLSEFLNVYAITFHLTWCLANCTHQQAAAFSFLQQSLQNGRWSAQTFVVAIQAASFNSNWL